MHQKKKICSALQVLKAQEIDANTLEKLRLQTFHTGTEVPQNYHNETWNYSEQRNNCSSVSRERQAPSKHLSAKALGQAEMARGMKESRFEPNGQKQGAPVPFLKSYGLQDFLVPLDFSEQRAKEVLFILGIIPK